jgi:putative membrane protein insertion efficiency factor
MKLARGAESQAGSSGSDEIEPVSPSLGVHFALALISFYRRWLSPLKGAPSCRYLPTCSEYALVAVRRHGAAKGSTLAAARILRCNPFFHAGFHPVPEAGHWAACEHEGPH